MSDYKLVPVEPTPEMIDAAAEAYMPFGDMALALQMGIVAAPDARGEPDVAGLVEALNKVMHCRYFVLLSSAVQHEVSATLAAHRKGGGDENHKQ